MRLKAESKYPDFAFRNEKGDIKMKQSVKWIALLCALLMMVSLVACGGEKKDDSSKKSDDKTAETTVEEPASNLTDFEWVKFEMPEGWSDAKESDAYVTVHDDANTKHIAKLFCRTNATGKSIEDLAKEDAAKDAERYSVDAPITINDRTWYPVRFKFNDNDSVRLFTDIDGGHYTYITIFEITETDPAAQKILTTIEFDPSKIS